MRHGMGLFPTTTDHAVGVAQFLETSAYEKLWITDSHQLYVDPYVALALCADATETLALATGVTNPVTRHPTVTANAIASVDQAADGRVSLGIGAGDSAVYSIGETPARVSAFRDALEDLRALLSGEAIECNGERFQLEQLTSPVPVHAAAEGPKTLEMAGAVADGVIFGGGTEPETVERGLERVADGAERAGRSLDDLHIAVLAPSCVAEDASTAVDALLDILEPIAYHNFSFSVDDAPAELRAELRDLVEAHEMREHGQADAAPARSLSPAVATYLGERFAIAGPATDCRERIEALAELGVDELLHGFPVDDPKRRASAFERRVL